MTDMPKLAASREITLDLYEIDRGYPPLRVASVTGHKQDAEREIAHYAAIYGQDGPVEIRTRRNRARLSTADEACPECGGQGIDTDTASVPTKKCSRCSGIGRTRGVK